MAIKIRCKVCDNFFFVSPSAAKRGRTFCSRACYFESRKGVSAWNSGVKGWQTKEHTDNIRKAAIKRNKLYPISSEQAAINGIKATRPFGDRHYRWKGGRKKTQRGYICVSAKRHPRQHNGYVFEHILVMEEHLGRFLKEKEVVHHVNGIINDNRIENLCLMFHGEHASFHHKGKKHGSHRKTNK